MKSTLNQKYITWYKQIYYYLENLIKYEKLKLKISFVFINKLYIYYRIEANSLYFLFSLINYSYFINFYKRDDYIIILSYYIEWNSMKNNNY